jgi:hypothetical protein
MGNSTADKLDETAERTGRDRTEEMRSEEPDDAAVNAPTLGERVAERREAIGKKVQSLSLRANAWFENLSARPFRAWAFVAFAAGFGLLMLLYGWALIKSFMVPFAPVWGLVLGGFTAFSMVKMFMVGGDSALWQRLVMMGGGALFGVGLFMFAALRAKPVAALLVVLSPFLIAATFVASSSVQMAIAIFFVGFVAGFAAMIQVRPIAIISTSLFGALSLLSVYGVLAYLLAPEAEATEEAPSAMIGSIQWLFANPWMLLLILAMVAFLGCNFQFATGPRGTLED